MKPKRADVLLSAVLTIVALLILCAGLYRFREFYHDDAYISLRYCRNLLSGNGLVWNAGERVEGYTGFLHVMLISSLGAMGFGLVAASRVVGVMSLAALATFVYVYERRRMSGHEYGLAPVPIAFALTACAFPLIAWSWGGLDQVLFTLLVTASMWLFAGFLTGDRQLGVFPAVLFVLACLTRPEGLLFVSLAVIWGLAVTLRSRWQDMRGVLAFAGLICVLYGPYCWWRHSYYGHLLPNTFYAKGDVDGVTITMGKMYLLSYALSPPFLLIMLFLGLVYTAITHRWDVRTWYLVTNVITFLAYVTIIGGDHMPAFRFILPVIPTMALLVHASIPRHTQRGTSWRQSFPPIAIILLLALQFLPLSANVENARIEDPAAKVGTLIGRYISETWPRDSLVALNTAGSTPYYASDLRFIDMLGLNDLHIARRRVVARVLPFQFVPGHLKGDGRYVLSRSPDFIILGPAEGTDADHPCFLSDLEIAQEPTFYADYEQREICMAVDNERDYTEYGATRSGMLVFTYYQKVKPLAHSRHKPSGLR